MAYLDENGNDIPEYLDDNGNPINLENPLPTFSIQETQNSSPFGRRVEASERQKLEEMSPAVGAKYLGEHIAKHPIQTAVAITSPLWAPEGIGAGLAVGGLMAGGSSLVDKFIGKEKQGRTQTSSDIFADVGTDAVIGALTGGLGSGIGRVLKGASHPQRLLDIDKAIASKEGQEFLNLQAKRVPPPTTTKTSEFDPSTSSYKEVERLDYTPTKEALAKRYNVRAEEVPTFEAAKARKLWEDEFSSFGSKQRMSEADITNTPVDKFVERFKINNPTTSYVVEQIGIPKLLGGMGKLSNFVDSRFIAPAVSTAIRKVEPIVGRLPYSSVLGTKNIPRLVRGIGQGINTFSD